MTSKPARPLRNEHDANVAMNLYRPHPQSTAGILLREFGHPALALQYAERKVRMLASMGNGVACDYLQAMQDLRAYIETSGPMRK